MKSNKLLKRIVAMGLCIALLSGDATLMNAEASENNTISTESLENVGASVGESEEMPSVVKK